MRIFVPTVIAVSLFCGCRDANPVVEVTDTRRLTYFDKSPSGNIIDQPPLGWRTIPPSQFRDMNFVAGSDEKVEIYVTNANGSVIDNANRWLGQFGLSPVSEVGVFQNLEILGRTSVLVEAEGSFGGGMGGEAMEDYAMLGAIRPTNGGLLTVKMVGPKVEIENLRDEFIGYCESMRSTSVTDIEQEGEKSE